jgi:hypothetical protein
MNTMTSVSLIVWATAIAGCHRAEPGRFSLPADAVMQANPGPLAVQHNAAPNAHVVIYYFHPTFRCAACLLAESLTHQVVQQRWKDAVDQGALQWRLVNFELAENKLLTKLFEVDSSTVVVATVRDGKPVHWEKTTDVWQRVQQPDTFKNLIHEQIIKLLSDE